MMTDGVIPTMEVSVVAAMIMTTAGASRMTEVLEVKTAEVVGEAEEVTVITSEVDVPTMVGVIAIMPIRTKTILGTTTKEETPGDPEAMGRTEEVEGAAEVVAVEAADSETMEAMTMTVRKKTTALPSMCRKNGPKMNYLKMPVS